MGMEENEGAVRLYSVGFFRALPTPDKHLSAHPAFQPTHKVPVLGDVDHGIPLMQPIAARGFCSLEQVVSRPLPPVSGFP
jgi:hypothetical protein